MKSLYQRDILIKIKEEIMNGKARTYKIGCLYGFKYNPLIEQPYWFDLLSVNSIERSTEYLILCFSTKNGFIIGEFIDNQNGELLSDKINELYLNTFSYEVMFPLRNDCSMAYNFQTIFDKDKIKKFFYDLSISCDMWTYTKDFL
ncbi:hypothetical protein CKY11_14550 [Enterococcus hirae]|nr:hypothetical protein CKY11_14550 [Enterococcus hirae]